MRITLWIRTVQDWRKEIFINDYKNTQTHYITKIDQRKKQSCYRINNIAKKSTFHPSNWMRMAAPTDRWGRKDRRRYDERERSAPRMWPEGGWAAKGILLSGRRTWGEEWDYRYILWIAFLVLETKEYEVIFGCGRGGQAEKYVFPDSLGGGGGDIKYISWIAFLDTNECEMIVRSG